MVDLRAPLLVGEATPLATALLAGVVLITVPTAGQQEAPAVGAFELLASVRAVYAEAPSYRDSGRIELYDDRAGGGAAARSFQFQTHFVRGRSFDLLLSEDSGGLGRETLLRVSADDDASSPRSGRATSLGLWLRDTLGPLGRYAFSYAVLLQDGADLFSEPQAASMEGRCPAGDCRVVSASLVGGNLELTLWIDPDTFLLSRLEVEEASFDGALSRAMSEAGLRPRQSSGSTARSRRRVVVTIDRSELGGPGFEVPPPDLLARRLAATPRAGANGSQTTGGVDREEIYREEIDVAVTSVRVRAVGSSGRPLLDLGTDDFTVRVGRREAQIVGVRWVSSEGTQFTLEELAELARNDVVLEFPGKLVVFFVQASLHASRAPGQLKMLPEIGKILDTLHPDDRVAVVSFDSHLKLRLDFTRSHSAVDAAMRKAIRFTRQEAVRSQRYPSLAKHLDLREARRAASPERALELVADSLFPLQGEKVVIYVGWGLGRYGAGGVSMTPDYAPARRALARAAATVFVLDITEADFHSLEVGLQQVASDTGGLYERAFGNTHLAARRVADAMQGYYEVSFSMPRNARKGATVRVRLKGRGELLVTQPG